MQSRGLPARRRSGAAVALDRRRRQPLQGARARARRGALAEHPGLPLAARPVPPARRGGARAGASGCPPAPARLFVGGDRRLPALRLRRAGQRAALLRAALARPPDGAQGDRLRDHAPAGQRGGVPALLGAGDLAGLPRWPALWWALVFALSLPISGAIAYRYLVGAGRLRSRLRFAALAATQSQAARRLVAEREAIIAELERARHDYLAATKGSSF